MLPGHCLYCDASCLRFLPAFPACVSRLRFPHYQPRNTEARTTLTRRGQDFPRIKHWFQPIGRICRPGNNRSL